jgi:hypothetical protein
MTPDGCNRHFADTRMWPCVAERYEEGRRYGAATVRAYGITRATRYIVAEANAGDLCQASAAGALDVLLDIASTMTPDEQRGYCEPCAFGGKHVHKERA